MSPPITYALTTLLKRSLNMISATRTSCEDATEHVRTSREAIARSLQLLSRTIPCEGEADWMEAAE